MTDISCIIYTAPAGKHKDPGKIPDLFIYQWNCLNIYHSLPGNIYLNKQEERRRRESLAGHGDCYSQEGEDGQETDQAAGSV